MLALTMRNPDRFRIHPELLGDDWIRTVARLAEQRGLRAQAQSLGTLILGGVRGLLLDLLTSGKRPAPIRAGDAWRGPYDDSMTSRAN